MTFADDAFFVSKDDPPAKQAILRTALDQFATRGVDGVTIRDIAARSGFSNPALFKHFAGKEDLARSLFEACYRQVAASFMMSGVSLDRAITRALDFIEAHPECVHFVLENLRRYWRDLPEEVRATGLLGAMRRLIEQEQAQGRIRKDVDAQLSAALVLGMLGQIARMAHFHELPRPPSLLAAEILGLIDRGLGM
jgi:AcrR family transcriptional regulator